jgi:hypothetical protein
MNTLSTTKSNAYNKNRYNLLHYNFEGGTATNLYNQYVFKITYNSEKKKEGKTKTPRSKKKKEKTTRKKKSRRLRGWKWLRDTKEISKSDGVFK